MTCVLGLRFRELACCDCVEDWLRAANAERTGQKPFVISTLLILAFGLILETPGSWYAMPDADGIVALVAIGIALWCISEGSRTSGFGLSPDPI